MKVKILASLLIIANLAIAQYTELTNTEGVTIKALVFDTGDPVKIKTEQGQYFAIPKENFAGATIESLSSFKTPQFETYVDLSTVPQTGELRNTKYRIIIKNGETPLLGFYPEERLLLKENFEKCIEYYESKVKGKSGLSVTAFTERANRISENPEPDLQWNISVKGDDVVFSIPKCYAPIVFTTVYIEKNDGFVDVDRHLKHVYDTRAEILYEKPPRYDSGPVDPFASPASRSYYDPFPEAKSNRRPVDPFSSNSGGLSRVSMSRDTFYYLYEYLKMTDFDKVVKEAQDSR